MKKRILSPVYNYIITDKETGQQERIENCILTYQHDRTIDFYISDTKYKTYQINNIIFEKE